MYVKKNNSFLKGAVILGIAGGIVKILGAMYRLPLSNIIKSEGMGYYQTAYPLYILLLTISTAGFPIAIAKLVSERRAVGDYKAAHKVFKVSLIGLLILGIATSLFVFFGAEFIVESLDNPNAYYALIALVPALLFVPIMSTFRGFFQGSQNMTSTALSQIVEQLFRVVSGLMLTYYLLDKGIPMAAGGASFGGSVGAIAGALTMGFIYFYKRKSIHYEIENSTFIEDYSVKAIIKDLLVIAIPITIGAAIVPIMDTIDVRMVLTRLQYIGYSEAQANGLHGDLKGMAQTLINLPQVFSIAIAMSLVPAIADANARKKREDLEKTISSGIRVTLLIALPASFGLFVLSRPIIALLYYKNSVATINIVGSLLRTLAPGVIFLTMVQAFSAILQGLGKPIIPAINLFVGAVVKVLLSYALIAIPSINIHGAAISTVIAFAIAAFLDLIFVVKYSKVKLSFKNIFLKPFLSALGMSIVAFFSYNFLMNYFNNRYATIMAIGIAALAYVLLLIITGAITSEDLSLMPKGDAIARKIEKFNLMK